MPTLKDFRSFGATVGGVFVAVLGLGLPWFRGEGPAWLFLAVGLALWTTALLRPKLLRIPYQAWQRLGEALGAFNSRWILGATYAFLIVPIGAYLKWRGKAPLKMDLEPALPTYRVFPDALRARCDLKRMY